MQDCYAATYNNNNNNNNSNLQYNLIITIIIRNFVLNPKTEEGRDVALKELPDRT